MADRRQMTREERRRARIIAERKRKKRRQRRMKQMIYRAILLLIIMTILLLGWKLIFGRSPVKSCKVEAGSSISLDQLIPNEKKQARASFVTDVSSIDTTVPGTYPVEIQVGKKKYTASVAVIDTIPPSGEAVSVIANKDVLPDPNQLVTNIQDVTAVTVSYKTEPNVKSEGTTTATVLLTDASGNSTEIPVQLQVIADTIAPVINCVKTQNVFAGTKVNYEELAEVTDDRDTDPKLSVDDSKVNINIPGSYEVVYTAEDVAGNQTRTAITVNVLEKPADYVEEEEVLALARNVYDDICLDSMSPLAKSFAIFNWVRDHINYTGSSVKSCWTRGAYDAFTKRAGDEYSYFAATKALLQVAGIQNLDICNSSSAKSAHYWNLVNLGDGWYHVDTTPRKGKEDNFFMVTDSELMSYSQANSNSHLFESNLYPDRATESIQSKINYSRKSLVEPTQ